MARSNSRGFLFLLLALMQVWSNGFALGGISAVRKTMKSSVGDVIDCVDIDKQPAFSHPLLKNHKIQLEYLRELEARDSSTDDDDELFQSWHREGECPLGTIPILRSPKILGPHERAAQATPQWNGRFNTSSSSFSDEFAGSAEFAQAVLPSGAYIGARGDFNVWIPSVADGEFSGSQMWVRSGDGNTYNSMQAGWMVKGGDNNARFYIYTNGAGSYSAGCFNLGCPGFVQTNHKLALGAALRPVSTYAGKQYNFKIVIKKDLVTKAWVLVLQNQYIGYWPRSIFTTLADAAEIAVFGGKITNAEPRGHHTTTQMGSGHFPSKGYGKAAYIAHIGYMDKSRYFQFKDASNLAPLPPTNPNCYDVEIVNSPQLGDHIYFGGPGYNANCQ